MTYTIFTTAKVDYDYHYCRVVNPTAGKIIKGARYEGWAVREIEVLYDYQRDAVTSRYFSALHLAVDREEFEKQIEAGYIERGPEPAVKTTLDNYTAVGIAEGFIEPESEEQYWEAWQHLIDTGICWALQGSFGRTARDLIKSGQCTPARGSA